MSDSPSTRPSLLVRLRDGRDDQAWSQFVDLYAPLIYGFALRHGLQDADAADLTQEVLRAVSGAMERVTYDPTRGSFRGWLFTVVRNELRTLRARLGRQCQGSGDTGVVYLLMEQSGPPDDPEALWNQQYERRLLAWAMQQVRGEVQEKTWQAFCQTAVEGKGAKETAKALGMTVAGVYMAKSRVLARLKEQVQELQGGDLVPGEDHDA